MKSIVQLDSRDYSPGKISSLKKAREVCVVFSTFGEREADLIHHKIALLREEAGDLVDRIILSHRGRMTRKTKPSYGRKRPGRESK